MVVVRRLNHAVLYVSDPRRSAEFYAKALGLEVAAEIAGGRMVFMRSPLSGNDHDLALMSARPGSAATPGGIGLYHLAWEVGSIKELAEAKAELETMGALAGESDHGVSKSLYCHDPDGIEFEVSWFLPPELIDAGTATGVIRPLDWERELARYG